MAASKPGERPMLKSIENLFTAKVLSVALVIEVGFIIGLYVGKTEALSPLQWAGAGVALAGAALLAAMVHAWPKAKEKKPDLRAWARD
jgi:hypothetical protein